MSPENLQDIVNRMRFPCDRGGLLRQATAAGVGDGELGPFGRLPEANYHDADAVHRALAELGHAP